jgi:hypothetical protein
MSDPERRQPAFHYVAKTPGMAGLRGHVPQEFISLRANLEKHYGGRLKLFHLGPEYLGFQVEGTTEHVLILDVEKNIELIFAGVQPEGTDGHVYLAYLQVMKPRLDRGVWIRYLHYDPSSESSLAGFKYD